MTAAIRCRPRGAPAGLPARCRGVTLIEILVAVLVLAVGLLGLANLQLATLQFNSSAYLRSQATNLAADMADRMRANRNAAIAAASPYQIGVTDAPPAPGTLPENDLNEWRAALANTLPGGTGAVVVAADGMVTIVVCWDDTRGAGEVGAPADCAAENLMGFRFETRL